MGVATRVMGVVKPLIGLIVIVCGRQLALQLITISHTIKYSNATIVYLLIEICLTGNKAVMLQTREKCYFLLNERAIAHLIHKLTLSPWSPGIPLGPCLPR